MQSKIAYSPQALKDLDEIWNYIEFKLYNPEATQNTVNDIIDSIDVLNTFPESGTKLIFENNIDSGYRYVIYKKYLAFYRLESDNIIKIDRIIYSSRDYINLLISNLFL